MIVELVVLIVVVLSVSVFVAVSVTVTVLWVVKDVAVNVLLVVDVRLGSSVVVVVGPTVVVVSSIRSQALAFTSDATKFRSAGHSVFATAVQFPPSLSQPHAATRHSPLFENAWHSTCGYRH